ncbi:MAG: Gfo/Idh/MocA family oxidoreductase [Planctomycetota bacterium]
MMFSSGSDLPTPRTIGLAIAGLGGFAAEITDRVRPAAALSETPPFRIVAVGDPAASIPAFAARRALLESEGVRVFDDFLEALAQPGVDAVWLPVPIPLHRRLVEASFAAGKQVVCEKPLAGCVADVDAMIRGRDAAGLIGLVGFHDLYHPQTMAVKRRLLAGEIGELTGVTVIGSWPRDTAYFNRAGWAGRQTHDGVAVYDSPANNAMAHYLMLGLFFLGDTPSEAATPGSADARTWRAAPIESYDTVDARFGFAGGRSLRLLLTHADRQTFQPQIILHGRQGRWGWTYESGSPPLVPVEQRFCCPPDTGQRMIAAAGRVLTGAADEDQPRATFETARAHAVAVEMIRAAGETRTFDGSRVEAVPSGHGGAVIHHVPGLLEAMVAAARTGEPLSV